VITRGTWPGANTGSLMGMPVTGKRFRSAGMVIDTVVDGAIVERWELSDLLGMLQQLGLVPARGV
jgi:predicted ester cyclase